MKQTFEVWHSFKEKNVVGYRHVASVTVDDAELDDRGKRLRVEGVLELVYFKTQNIDRPWLEQPGVTPDENVLTARSSMMGDLFVHDGPAEKRIYEVEGIGFKAASSFANLIQNYWK